MDKQNVAYSYSGLLLSYKKKENTDMIPFFWVVLEFELRASHLLGRSSTT
jgi:hypothetical protein